jgi:bile acid:Na+ symporter, BASS family
MNNIANSITFCWLFCLMLQMGFSISLTEMVDSLREKILVGKGLVVNFMIIPIFGFLMLWGIAPSEEVAIGFFIAVIFAGPSLGPVLTSISKGKVPFALGFMVVLAILSGLVSPFILLLLINSFPTLTHISIPLLFIVKVITVGQLLPLVIGLTLSRYYNKIRPKITKYLRPLNFILAITAISLMMITQWSMLSAFTLTAWGGMLILFIGIICISWFMGGPRLDTRKALIFNSTIPNGPAALVVVSMNLAGTPAPAAVLAFSLFALAGSTILSLALRKI